MEDLTTGAAPAAELEQLEDLKSLGIDHDGPLIRQSERSPEHDTVLHRLEEMGATFPCFCSRREIREATMAPHGPDPAGPYPGTCARLSTAESEGRLRSGLRAATRIRAEGAVITFTDRLHGQRSTVVDDFVLCRADGLVAYNLAVVVDDADAGVDQVVRGDDLLETTQRQVFLQQLLGLPTPEYIHVPLVLGPDGSRLSKRHGSVGLKDQLDNGADPAQVLALLAHSIGLGQGRERLGIEEVLAEFDRVEIPKVPWMLDPVELAWS